MAQANDFQTSLDSLFDYLYANAPVRTPIAIWEEIQKILRTGIFIEQSRGLTSAFSFTRNEQTKLSRFDNPITSLVASRVRSEYAKMTNQLLNPTLDAPIALNDQNIAQISHSLSGIPLSSLHFDALGEALEVFRHNWTKRNGGQFFTDPAITRLAVQLLEFDPHKGHDLVDLAAGTGGFLIAAANHIKNKLLVDSLNSGSENFDFPAVVKESLKGVEIDQSLADIANMTIGARIGVSDAQLVAVGDSLDPSKSTRLSEFGIKDSAHLCAATNPPFGSKITVRDPSILATYETSYLQNQGRSALNLGILPAPTSLDLLFLERNLRILKPDYGRLAIVLPYQMTSGPQAFPIRRWLLRHAILEAVVDLPPETFQPYTGTKTCLVLLRRRPAPLRDLSLSNDSQIFMSVPKWIGHDRRGKRVFETSPAGHPTGELLSDIDDVARAFQTFRNGGEPSEVHSNSFAVPAHRVFGDSQLRFNARYFQPNTLLDTVGTLSKSQTWRAVKLGDVTEGIFFPSRFRRRYVEPSADAVPFLGGTNISQFVPIIDKWLSKDDPLVAKLQVFPGWLLITRSGSTGIVSSVPAHWAGWTVSEHVIRVIPNPEILHPSYLEAYLRTKFAKASILRGVFGSVIDEITPEFLSEIEILVPTSGEMRRRIVDAALKAQTARENAIEHITQAVDLIEEGMEYGDR